MTTLLYFFALLTSFGVQFVGDSRCIADTAGALHWKVGSLRWSPFAPFGPRNGWERCYQVRIQDQHGRVSLRTCRVTGVIGLPMQASFDPATVDATSPAHRSGSRDRA